MVEHALASALKHVRLSHEQFWKELRVACPRAAAAAPLDHRSDITQIGVVTLSLLLGRALKDDEYPSQLSTLVAGVTTPFGALCWSRYAWLQRALQPRPRSFASAIRPVLCSTKRWSGVTALQAADLQRSGALPNRVMPFARVPLEAALMSRRPHRPANPRRARGAVHGDEGAATQQRLRRAPLNGGGATPQPVDATPAPSKGKSGPAGPMPVVTPAIATANRAAVPGEISLTDTCGSRRDAGEKKDASDSTNHSLSARFFPDRPRPDEPARFQKQMWQRAAAAAVSDRHPRRGLGRHESLLRRGRRQRPAAACEHHPAVAAVRIGRHAKRLALDGQ